VKKTIIYSSFLVLIVSISSCVRNANNVDIKPENPLLVVTCFISPSDTIVKAKVSKSIPVLGKVMFNNSGNTIDNASVAISNADQKLVLEYDPNISAYKANVNSLFKIEAGKEYAIEVSTPDGMRVNGKTTVPANTVAQEDIEIIRSNNSNSSSAVFEVLFKDFPNQENFYRLEAYYTYSNFYDSSRTATSSLFWEEDMGFNLYDDSKNAGRQIRSLKVTSYNDQTVFLIHHLSKDYYLYHKSLEKFEGDNPFAEPVLVYSNINNGLGVFAGLQTTKIKYIITNP
jgi:hypothetical protein